jgi:hypothetical protein
LTTLLSLAGVEAAVRKQTHHLVLVLAQAAYLLQTD